MRNIVKSLAFVCAVCLIGTWALSQEPTSAPEVWLRHQTLRADPAFQRANVRLFFKTSSAIVADSFVISWTQYGKSPDSLRGERRAIPYVPSHFDSLQIQRNFARTDTLLVAGWTRSSNRWSRRLLDTVIVARDTLRPRLDISAPDSDTIPPGRVNDLG